MGFPVPLHEWARGRSAQFFRDTLMSRRCRERGLFDASMVERLLGEEEPFSRKLWGLLSLELWFDRFFDDAAAVKKGAAAEMRPADVN
jgi:asparagine synthase (glutamine-hydrolysing)